MGREDDYGIVFAGVTYYDGQAFLVPKSRNFQSALELDGSKVCVQPGTTTEPNFIDLFRNQSHEIRGRPRGDRRRYARGLQGGKCDVLTTDESGLFALRLQLPKPADHVILPDVIRRSRSVQPCRQDDMQWFNTSNG